MPCIFPWWWPAMKVLCCENIDVIWPDNDPWYLIYWTSHCRKCCHKGRSCESVEHGYSSGNGAYLPVPQRKPDDSILMFFRNCWCLQVRFLSGAQTLTAIPLSSSGKFLPIMANNLCNSPEFHRDDKRGVLDTISALILICADAFFWYCFWPLWHKLFQSICSRK